MEIDIVMATIYFFIVCTMSISIVFDLMKKVQPVFFSFLVVCIIVVCLVCFADLSDGFVFTMTVSLSLAGIILIPFCLMYYMQNKKLF